MRPIRIFIFTGPIRSGKTTALMNWVGKRSNIGGFLTPDKGELRYLFTLYDRKWHDFQVADALAKTMPESQLVTISKFNFLSTAFGIAHQTLLNDPDLNPDWIIIDEVGKLELMGLGLEPALKQVLAYYKTSKTSGALLMVVREELLEAVKDYYQLEHFQVIKNLNSLF
ncbi:MAG: hypothetical protein KDC85_16135 [Saprospiraceae bacterium]|nr:hypothetical protein [Saprospiraceae bacterium]MCB9325950.1 hypothetical protein [Lewinellaceae bacterium]